MTQTVDYLVVRIVDDLGTDRPSVEQRARAMQLLAQRKWGVTELQVEVVPAQDQFDQYGFVVPDDLVMLNEANSFPKTVRDSIRDNLVWWEAKHPELPNPVVLVSYIALASIATPGLYSSDAMEMPVAQVDCVLDHIASGLKRWNPEDGFYHA